MRIKRVEIENYRCINHCLIEVEDTTTFIGPNGVGKSSVLRALDWFFNGDKGKPLTEKDLYSGAAERKITVKVEFEGISTKEREILGEKYAPANVNTFTAWKIWDNGSEKITGKALAFLPFEHVRAGVSAAEQKARLEEVTAQHPDLGLPRWTSAPATLAAFDEWERQNPESLESAQVSDTNFFGFAGQGKLSGLFDFALVSADMRASEEGADNRTSIIGRILEKAIDRSLANEQIAQLGVQLVQQQLAINAEHIDPQLVALSEAMSAEVAAFAVGRTVSVKAEVQEFKAQTLKFQVSILDHLAETMIDRQGHGFQRTLLIAALKLLARPQPNNEDDAVLCLAIEEPELFQHPTQCRAFAKVLRTLAEDPTSGIQVAYATHSPYFIEPKYFDQIRRMSRNQVADQHATVSVSHATLGSVCARLIGCVDTDAVARQLDNACIGELGEAVFAQAAVLVEGTADAGILEGAAARQSPLSVSGIAVATCGKTNIPLNHAILAELNIPTYVIFDGDSGCAVRMTTAGKAPPVVTNAETANKQLNRKLLRYLGRPEVDWPNIGPDATLMIFDDTLETFLETDWIEWGVARDALIAASTGYEGKNAGTYLLAALQATVDPPNKLTQALQHIRTLATG